MQHKEKFEIGETVEITGNSNHHGFKIGEIVTLIRKSGNKPLCYVAIGTSDTEWVIVPTDFKKRTPEYHIGDMVRIIKSNSHDFKLGTIGTITGIDQIGVINGYIISIDDGNNWWVYDYQIEPITMTESINVPETVSELIDQHKSTFDEFVAACNFIRVNEDFLNRNPAIKQSLIDVSETLKEQSMEILDKIMAIKIKN